MLDDIRDLFAYHRWANERIVAAAAQISPEQLTRDLRSSFPSVLDTLRHVLQADWIWLERWHGASPAALPESWSLDSVAAIAGRWAEIEARRSAFLQTLHEADLQRAFSYRNTQGTPFESILVESMRHVVNHATYHRGQLTTMLRQLGVQPPNTDLIGYYRAKAAQRA